MKVDYRKLTQWSVRQGRNSYTNCAMFHHVYHLDWLGREVLPCTGSGYVGVQSSQGHPCPSLVEGDRVHSSWVWSRWHEAWCGGRHCRPAESVNHAVNVSKKDNWKPQFLQQSIYREWISGNTVGHYTIMIIYFWYSLHSDALVEVVFLLLLFGFVGLMVVIYVCVCLGCRGCHHSGSDECDGFSTKLLCVVHMSSLPGKKCIIYKRYSIC